MTGEEFLDGVEAAAGLAVHGAAAVPGATAVRAQLIADSVPGLLVAKDPTLWGPAAEATARTRLGWVDTFRRSRELTAQLAEIRAELPDLDNLVLAGMGGSSLAPEVITRTMDRPMTVLDTTDPGQVRRTMFGGAAPGSPEAVDLLRRTLVVVSSKSGTTVETDSHRRAYQQAFLDAGLTEAETGRHFVIVTDPGSPLAATGRQMGAYVLLADPDVGGRYSALTAFGLVPAALAGADVTELLDQAEELFASLASDPDNPALALGAALAAAFFDWPDLDGRGDDGRGDDGRGDDGRNSDGRAGGEQNVALVLAEDGTGIAGLGDWAEQLVAESTGKDGKGILPLVVESPTAPGTSGNGVLTVTVGGSLPPDAVPGGGLVPHLAVNGPLGAQFLAWEYATAIAARVLRVNPFDQPDVQETKDRTAGILAAGFPAEPPDFVEGAIEVYGTPARTLPAALNHLVASVPAGGYLSVMAYLDRSADADVARLRPLLAGGLRNGVARHRASGTKGTGDLCVTFGWGPRFLHSTGQYHKGGPPAGAFLQITGAVTEDLPVPGRPYPFGQLQAAQATGDRQALARLGRPLLRLHLTDRRAGIAALLAATERLATQRPATQRPATG